MNTRRHYITLIHLAKNQLNLTDDAYQALLVGVAGVNSCRQMNIPQLKSVLSAFKARGFVVKPKARKYQPNLGDDDERRACMRKIGALLASNNLNWAYARGIAQRSVKKQALQWCTLSELHKVLQILASHLHKQGKRVK